jgi:hypothetical protein
MSSVDAAGTLPIRCPERGDVTSIVSDDAGRRQLPSM